MANPQLENGYTRTANELSEAIMQSDFSKRQLNILNLVIRMSYGCGKKSALLRYSDFELVGVHKSDIKRELEYLSGEPNVLHTEDIGDMLRISINKDYTTWRISIVKGFNQQKWDELLARNLDDRVGETLTEVGKIPTRQNNQVGKIPTNISEPVGNLPTTTTSKSSGDNGLRHRKEILFKEINDLVVVVNEDGDHLTPDEIAAFDYMDIKNAYESNFGIPVTINELNRLWDWHENDGMPVEVIIYAIVLAARAGKRNCNYVDGILRNWYKDKLTSLAAIATAEYEFRSRDKPGTIRFNQNRKVVQLKNGRSGISGEHIEGEDPINVSRLIIRPDTNVSDL